MTATIIADDINVTKLLPREDHILVKLLSREQTEGGVWLPKNTATPCRVGKVLSVGKEIPNPYNGKGFPIQVKVDSYVLFMDYAGEKMRVAWKDYRLIRESSLWANVELSASTDLINFEEVSPRADRLLLELSDESMSKGGSIYLAWKDQPIRWRIGIVKRAGYGVWHLESGKLLPTASKVGDRVIFRRYAGAELSMHGKSYRLIQEADVMGILGESGEIEKALHGNVIVRRLEAKDSSDGGILTLERAREKLREGIVICSDPGVPYENGEPRRPIVEKGQSVLFKLGLEDVNMDGVNYVVCNRDEILGVID